MRGDPQQERPAPAPQPATPPVPRQRPAWWPASSSCVRTQRTRRWPRRHATARCWPPGWPLSRHGR
eukprot:10099247-Lingulodinium_polyedra.AAC.1